MEPEQRHARISSTAKLVSAAVFCCAGRSLRLGPSFQLLPPGEDAEEAEAAAAGRRAAAGGAALPAEHRLSLPGPALRQPARRGGQPGRHRCAAGRAELRRPPPHGVENPP